MNKKILILNGSPRKNGNTSELIKEFTRGAEESENIVNTFFLDNMNINGCKSCYAGGKDLENPCTQKDDMDKIYPVYQESDIVVFASPLYYWTISGQLKIAFDRLFALSECYPNYSTPKKDSLLLMVAGGYGFEESTYWYDRVMKHIEWNNLGHILVGGVTNIGDIKGKPELLEAYKLGKSI